MGLRARLVGGDRQGGLGGGPGRAAAAGSPRGAHVGLSAGRGLGGVRVLSAGVWLGRGGVRQQHTLRRCETETARQRGIQRVVNRNLALAYISRNSFGNMTPFEVFNGWKFPWKYDPSWPCVLQSPPLPGWVH